MVPGASSKLFELNDKKRRRMLLIGLPCRKVIQFNWKDFLSLPATEVDHADPFCRGLFSFSEGNINCINAILCIENLMEIELMASKV